MNHIAGFQVSAGGDDGLTGGALPDFSAFLHNGRSAGAVDGPVHAAASRQAGIGGVDDGLGFLLGNDELEKIIDIYI